MKMEKEFKRKIQGGDPIISPKLHDIPLHVWEDYLAYARLYYDGKVSSFMKDLLELFKKHEAKEKDQYEDRLRSLEDRMAELEKSVYHDKEHDNNKPKTFAD